MSTCRHCGVLGVFVTFILWSDLPQAQTELQAQLETAQRLDCVFPLIAIGTWTDGEPQAEVKPTDLSFQFESIDPDEGVADALGLFGPSHIVARFSGESLHFMQVGRSGPLYVTTVFARESREGKLIAVHTRHEYTPASVPGFTSRPEQYYGECEIQP